MNTIAEKSVVAMAGILRVVDKEYGNAAFSGSHLQRYMMKFDWLDGSY